MIAMIFEYWFDPDAPDIYEEYTRASEEVRRQLAGVDGFHGVERFRSTVEPDKYVTIGLFSDEAAVERWRNHAGHRRIQALGRDRLFVRYRLRMADITRDYTRDDRGQAPQDSRDWHENHERELSMYDIELRMGNRPGELARMGRALGAADVSVEGGGMFLVGDVGVAHFLVTDPAAALDALAATGLEVASCRDVLAVRLDQDEAGQLGKLTAAMADANVNIETLYSDHDHRLILLVDNTDAGRRVADGWTDAPPS